MIAMIFMAVAAMHFGLIYAVFATRSFKPLNHPVVKYYFISIVVLSIGTALSLKLQGGYQSWGKAFMDGSFNVVSYMSTTGFAICDNSLWPWLAGVLLLFAGFQCGCSGSTTGGIKADRVLIAFKTFCNEIRKRVYPSAMNHVRFGDHALPDAAVTSVMKYIVVYVVVILFSIIGVMLCGTDIPEAISGVVSSVGSVGPGLSELGSVDNYSAQPVMSKLIFTFDMFLGRLEIFPIFVAMFLMFKRGH